MFRKKETIDTLKKTTLFIDPSQANTDLFMLELVKAKKKGKQVFILNPSPFISAKLINEGAIVNQSLDFKSEEILVFEPGAHKEGNYYSFLYEQHIKEVVEYIRLKTNYPLTAKELTDLQEAVEEMYSLEGITHLSYKPTLSKREGVLTFECLLALIATKNEALYRIVRDYNSFKGGDSSVLQQLFIPQLPKTNLEKEICLFTYKHIPTYYRSKKIALYESLCMIQRDIRNKQQESIVVVNDEIATELIDFFKGTEELISYVIMVKRNPFLMKEKETEKQRFGQIILSKPLGVEGETICSDCGVPKKLRKHFLYETDESLMVLKQNEERCECFVGSFPKTIDLFTKEGLL